MIVNDSWQNFLPQFDYKYFDLTLGDPPYFKGPNKRGYYGKKVSTTSIKRPTYPKTEDWQVPDINYLHEIQRVSNHQIVFGINYYKWFHCSGRIIWDKCNGTNTFSDAEIASCTYHDSVRLFKFLWNGMMQGKSISEGHIQRGDKRKNQKRIHPTEKPIELYDWIFKTYLPNGGRVLDTHIGSGSIRIAADKAGNIELYGCEINKTHFDNQEKRFSHYKQQLEFEY